MTVYAALSEEECYLYSILTDESGLDIAEFTFIDETQDDSCFRAWHFQWDWWRCSDQLQIDRGSRSCGKSLSIKFRAFAFPFCNPGEEMVITAPEGVHLDAVTDNVETLYLNTRLAREMISRGRGGIKHRPFMVNFANGSRIMGRIPQRDGKGVKGCAEVDTPILTADGFKRADDVSTGDTVWTHEGWSKVLSVEKSLADTCYEVNGQGSWPLTVSWDHRFYGASNLADSKHKRDFSNGMWWGITEDLVGDQFYWATPTRFDPLPIPDPNDGRGLVELPHGLDEFWWLVGRYVADGHLSTDKGTSGKVHWSVHPKDQEEVIARLDKCELHWNKAIREHSSADVLYVCSTGFADWLKSQFGSGASTKSIPAWALGMEESHRKALLEGYLSGDGHWSEKRGRWGVGTASELLAYSLQVLAQSLGMKCSGHYVAQPNVTHILGVELKSQPKPSYRFSIYPPGRGKAMEMGEHLLGKVQSVTNVGPRDVVNIITDAHSYLSGSIMSHNIHPIWLEMDEASDWPELAWAEVIETVKIQNPKARWRCHGVTRGIGGGFDERCQPDSGWKVHALPAMYRPNWTEEERVSKIQEYGGSTDAVDYRRNVLGLPGDQNSPIFVLYRLMEVTDIDLSSDFNTNEYVSLNIDESMIREVNDIAQLLDFPGTHMRYKNFWIGMDVGWTQAPSSIVIFAEEAQGKGQKSKLKLLARIILKKVSTPDQTSAIIHLIDTYRPQAFALDSTGAGFPLFERVQEVARSHPELKHIVPRIKGYNFSEKVIAEFDDSIKVNENDPNGWKEAAIKRNVLEWSTDVLRGLVDEKRLVLPYDKSIIGEFQGQTWTYSRSALDAYGRKKLYSSGSFHTLDACRMAVLAYQQEAINQFIDSKDDLWQPPPMVFL